MYFTLLLNKIRHILLENVQNDRKDTVREKRRRYDGTQTSVERPPACGLPSLRDLFHKESIIRSDKKVSFYIVLT